MEDKISLRKRIQQLKKRLSEEQCEQESYHVFTQLENLDVYKKAKHILCYWSLPDEIETHAFINNNYKDKNIYLPKVVGSELSIHSYQGIESMAIGAYGIMEPNTNEFIQLEKLELIIVPGIAFTKTGKRMGRGRGYYDRFLPKVPAAIKVGIAYRCQITEEITTETHDVNMDVVLTLE